MKIPRENWALIFELRDEVIDRDHPDFDFWTEESHLLELVEGGAAPPAEETPAKAPKPLAPTLAVNLTDAAKALSVSDEHFATTSSQTSKSCAAEGGSSYRCAS